MADPKQDTFSLEQLAAKYSIAASILASDPSLVDALNRILKGKIVDPKLQMAELQKSEWFLKNSEDFRKFQIAKATDPTTFEADLITNTNKLLAKYKQAGIPITPQEATALAEKLMMKSQRVDGKITVYDDTFINKTLAGAIDSERGWGLEHETWTAMGALSRYATTRPIHSHAAPTWFNLGDKDLATHFYRTARLAEGATLAQVTAEIAQAWGLDLQLVPMTNDSVQTVITLAEDCEAGKAGAEISFQEYFVKHHHSVAASAVKFVGSAEATPNGLELLASADSILIAPSNPLVSIAPIRSLSGVDSILAKRRDSVCAISPIVNGAALKGPADRLMTELGHEPTVVGVAKIYAPICGTLIIDNADAHLASAVETQGMRCIVTDTIMKSPQVSAALAKTALDATR